MQWYRDNQVRSPSQLDDEPGDLDPAPLRTGVFAVILQPVDRLAHDIVEQVRTPARRESVAPAKTSLTIPATTTTAPATRADLSQIEPARTLIAAWADPVAADATAGTDRRQRNPDDGTRNPCDDASPSGCRHFSQRHGTLSHGRFSVHQRAPGRLICTWSPTSLWLRSIVPTGSSMT